MSEKREGDDEGDLIEYARQRTAETGNKTLALPTSALMCSRHREPFFQQWPKGYAQVVKLALDEVVAKDKALFDAATRDGVLDTELVTALLQAKPACCRVSPELLIKTYEAAEIGTRARCSLCKRKRLGTPYRTQQGDLPHLCFECVVHRTMDVRA